MLFFRDSGTRDHEVDCLPLKVLKKSVNLLVFVTTKLYDHFQIWYVKPVLLVLLNPESHRKSRAVESRVDGDSMDSEG